MGTTTGRLVQRVAPSLLMVAACAGSPGSGSTPGDPLPYLDDSSFRRSELVASLVNPHNEYSQLRLDHYESGGTGDWALLPEWNPPVDVIAASELDAPDGASVAALSGSASPLELPTSVQFADDPALLALGEAAFSRYPVQLTPYLTAALSSREAASTYGVWVDDARGVGGLVRARMADGTIALGETCATCHSAHTTAGTWTPGMPNARLDEGAAVIATEGAFLGPSLLSAIEAWGPGRLDVTTSTGLEPVRIADLRPVRWLTYLQQDATLRARDLTTLAIRIETLIITSSDEAIRPPRLISLALAAYVTSLASALPAVDAAAAASPRGAGLFEANCTGCHTAPALTGNPVPLATIGTDPTLGLSPVRGTGAYRVPSLHGVGTRGPLLHDGTAPSLAAFFDATRVTPAFTGKLHGTGAVPGHVYGLDLSDPDRAALVAYLQGL
jgi:hypothetical protein